MRIAGSERSQFPKEENPTEYCARGLELNETSIQYFHLEDETVISTEQAAV